MVEGVPGGSGTSRLKSLDALRGFAALAVVVFHFTGAFDSHVYFPGYPKSPFVFAVGKFGVHLFFIISGFVILWSIQRQTTVGKFAWSRFTRLFPPYWASLLLVSGYILLADHIFKIPVQTIRFTLPQFLANIPMVPRWVSGGKLIEIDGVYWSLAAEMGFYVLIVVLMSLKLTKKNRIVPTMATIWAVDLTFNAIRFVAGVRSHNHFVAADYLSLFLVGMSLFLLYSERDRPKRDRQILWVIVCCTPLINVFQFAVPSSVVVAGLIATAYVAIFHDVKILHTRVLQWLGGISYSLYLVHCFPGYITMAGLMTHGWGRVPAMLVAVVQSFILAIILNKTVEKPVTRWLRQRRSNVKPVPQIATS
jgi:peptidoglycan/LPS O-acetylase OafA/YrhL